MIHLLRHTDDSNQKHKGFSSLNGHLDILNGFNSSFEECSRNERLVIVVGKSCTGKSTLINALLGVKLEENEDGKMMKINELVKGPKIGNGIRSETQFAECFQLNGSTLLDPRGFVGSNIDIEGDILSALIMEANKRKAKKVMVIYLSEFDNYCNLSKMKDDAKFINKICDDIDLPIIFIANKCTLRWAVRKDESGQLGDVMIEKIQNRLHKDFKKLYEDQLKDIRQKIFKNSDILTVMEMIGALEKNVIDAEVLKKANMEECLIQLKALYVLKSALDGGRLLYYDPLDFYSVERIKSMVHDENYFVQPNRVTLGGSTSESRDFLTTVSEIALVLGQLVTAMEGRRRVPAFLREVSNACGDFSFNCNQLLSAPNERMKKLENTLSKITIDTELSSNEIRKGEEANIDPYQKLKEEYELEIALLDSDEPVKYDSIEFYEHENYLMNERRIRREIEVPHTTYKFIPRNEYTFSDEGAQREGIEDGVFRAVYRAPDKFTVGQQLFFTLTTLGVLYAFDNPRSECCGEVEFYAPSRDIPKNQEKMRRLRAKVQQLDEQMKKVQENVELLKELREELEECMEIIEKKKKEEERWNSDQLVLVECLEFCDECDKLWEDYQYILLLMYQFAANYVPEKFIAKAKKEIASERSCFYHSSSSFASSSSSSTSSSSTSPSPSPSFSSSPSSFSSSPSSPSPSHSTTPFPPSPYTVPNSSSVCVYESAYQIFERFRHKEIAKGKKEGECKSEDKEEEEEEKEKEKEEEEEEEEEEEKEEEEEEEENDEEDENERPTSSTQNRAKRKESPSHSSHSSQTDKILMRLARFIASMDGVEEVAKKEKEVSLKTQGRYDPALVGAAAETVKYMWGRMGRFRRCLEEFKKFDI
ncbi:putative 50S ribosome-binding GTPase [Monocercomonoides exilis]|uniref:putative 50S ribosome-binding GTPase n=1 Tax=Monocercomonoides exilis TaxID=2049356 RepID=UPI0035595698|nr:putative 50S ribosome-binding GTPase [Monocercomonoides exilis]|eukprot:MONOS_2862.1-p1 / transcript=MONOS_2862.1 / gene=MONOS_2862 / organism=Monocercomonoides_exilis_PA203 / gene_product=50S ribosome-binding GTPase / transcript_product=50S ribosome-binding GTPase / location=Mono_scaffold00062:41634-44261(-) / protein_length=876 / sequence_SO=supercontig / SO=protein_coding / is_pseudo=false